MTAGILPEFQASPYFNNPWKLFRNASGETIPPFSVMRITTTENVVGPDGAIRFVVAKPNDTFCTDYLINGPYAVRNGKDGRGTTLAQAGYVAYRDGAGTPAYGEEWGAKNGQWTVEKYRPGFIIEGGNITSAGVTAVVARQFVVVQLLAVNQEDLEQGGKADVVPWFRKIDDSKWEASEYLFEAADWYLNEDETIERGTKLEVSLKGIWTVTGAYCSPSDDQDVIDSLDPAPLMLTQGEMEAGLQDEPPQPVVIMESGN